MFSKIPNVKLRGNCIEYKSKTYIGFEVYQSTEMKEADLTIEVTNKNPIRMSWKF